MSRRKNGQGSVKKLSSGKYRMRKQVGYLPNGRPRIKTVTGTSETDCIKKMREIENDNINLCLDSDIYKKMTLGELCINHLQAHLSERDRLKAKAADRRESTIKNQVQKYKIGKIQAASVSPNDVKDHIEYLISEDRLSISSIEKALNVINSAYKWASDQGFTHYNPCTPVMESLKTRLKHLEKRDSSDGIVTVLSSEETEQLRHFVEQMTDEYPHRKMLGYALLLLMYTGMRVGELCALRWGNWSASTRTLSITKTRFVAINRNAGEGESVYVPGENAVKNYQCRTIDLLDNASKTLSKMKVLSSKNRDDDYILLNKRGNPTNPSNFDDNILSIYRDAGLEVSGAHILRRTLATQLYEEGIRLESIAAYLGDLPETVREHYISLTKRVVAGGEVKNVVRLTKLES